MIICIINRSNSKNHSTQNYSQDLKEYTRVNMSGKFINDETILVGPRTHVVEKELPKNGYTVITPFVTNEFQVRLLVNRGWIAKNSKGNISSVEN